MRINKTLLLIGIALAVVAVGGLLFIGRLLNPAPTKVPVAIQDITAGTPLTPAQFRLEEWTGVRPETLHALYGMDDFPANAVALVDVPAGSPLYKAYVDTAHNAEFVTRLSNLVKDTGQVALAIPVKPDTGGNLPKTGDQVDLVFSLGSVRQEQVQSHPTPTPALPNLGGLAGTGPTTPPTETLSLPLSALILQNVRVLKVEYKQVTTSSGYGADGSTQPVTVNGPAERVYVAVTREQSEVLGFLLHNGDVLLAVHQGNLPENYPGGITWEDFETWYFARRPDPPAPPVLNVQPGYGLPATPTPAPVQP